uniref:BTB domain-containing protein n=1 Tax=Panagrellus redivivus TaxID=6233 RepID=A0A7E4W8S2_PANRE
MGNCISVGQPYERLDDSEEGYDVVHVIDDCQVPVRHIPIDPPFNLNGCKELSDVTFVVDKTEFPAHRRILSERSDYFSEVNYVLAYCSTLRLLIPSMS